MRQEATRSPEVARRFPISLRHSRARPVARLLAAASLVLACAQGPSVASAAEPLRVLAAKLASPVKRVMALTCPGLAPADLVDYPQRPGTPDPSPERPPVRTVLVQDDQGRRLRVRVQGEALLVEPFGNCPLPAKIERADLVDGGRVSQGTGVIAEAWLASATLKYRHGILGNVVTAAELRATNRNGQELRYRLPDDAVFEDRWARMVVVDGQDAVLVVRSGLADGAAAMLLGFDRPTADAANLMPLAQSAPLGGPNRWLNPIGAGDFDGSGRTGIAAVLLPHAGGALVVYQRSESKLVERYRAPGFSNHQIYSEELGMSAMLDVNGDGILDLAVPDAKRMALRIVTFAHGKFAELQHVPHESPIVTGIAVQTLANGPALVYGLEDGTVVVLSK